MNHELNKEDKRLMMVQWWEKSLGILANKNFKKQNYGKVVISSKILFRDGLSELLQLSQSLGVPLTVVSAGIKEIIQACFYAISHNGEI